MGEFCIMTDAVKKWYPLITMLIETYGMCYVYGLIIKHKLHGC